MLVMGVIFTSRDFDQIVPEDRLGLLEHSSILALNCIRSLFFPECHSASLL